MIPSNTICVSQEGPANALALNKDANQVVIAGRNVFKIFAIGEEEFSEVCNLRVGKNLNLNFSSIDVAWSTLDENTLATAATNGAVVVWNLGRSGRSKQEHVFSDHKRTVNKVSFHLTDPALLISGSQDGMMKCFDLRMKEVARTFISNTESIRDVQFSPHQSQTFAAVSENGSVQLWDARRHERCLHQFTAHSGPVFACDWHPDAPWLATASRDKTIKVWDIHAKPNLEHTIYTIASVGHVKWRPQRKYQVASCALVLDCAVHVWDVRRPHVPLATFAEHRDVTTAVAWLAAPAFLSTSRDCTLYRHRFAEAAHPALWANPHGVCVSARGRVAHAAPARPLPPLASAAHPAHLAAPAALGRKQPTAGSLSASAQATLERLFPSSASSLLVQHRWRSADDALVQCAVEYRIRGDTAAALATHNASVARRHQRALVAHVWDVAALVCAARAAGPRPPAPPPPAEPAHPHPHPLPRPHPHPHPLPRPRADAPPAGAAVAYGAVEEEPLEEVEEWSESQFQLSGVLGLPTHSIYIPPAKYMHALDPDDENAGWVSAASAHYVDEDAYDWTLPEEAFPLRTQPPAPPAPPAPPTPPAAPPAPLAGPSHDPADGLACQLAGTSLSSGAGAAGGGSGSSGASCSPGGSSGGGAGAGAGAGAGGGAHAPQASPTHKSYSQQSSLTTEGGAEGAGGGGGGAGGAGGELCVRAGAGGAGGAAGAGGPFNTAPLLARALRQHADLGDVQTAAVVMLALQEHRNELFPYIDESLQEQWLLGYIELLQRHKLWNVATEVIKCAWLGSVWTISQQSTSVAVCCGRCGRRTRPHAPCDRCSPRHVPDLCAVCRRVVRGLYAWCQGCSHGGHLHHMQQWMQKYQLCPAGCGHRCQLG